jgi:hypothetical protein
MYLNCPRCRLAMKLRVPSLAMRHCPRCVARAGMLVELFTSPLPYERLAGPRQAGARDAPPLQVEGPEALAG